MDAQVGHFEGAICPDADTFSEELQMLESELEGKKKKKLLIYCTGGIRCEKTSAFLKHKGFEECMRIRETCNDETFLKTHLNYDLCKELNLFSYAFNKSEGINRITEVSAEDTWRTIRDDLIRNVGLNSIPVIVVEELLQDGTLILKHVHDGRDLELTEANKVFEHINNLWEGGVRFTTIIEDDLWEF